MIRRGLAAALMLGLVLLTTTPLPAAESQKSLIERYRQALAADPDNLTLHYLLGIALLDVGQSGEALESFRRSYPAFRTSLEANFNLSLACLKLNDLDGATLYFDQAEALGLAAQTEIYPAANLAYNLALKALENGQENEAIRLFHRVLAFDPERAEVYRQLGGLHARRGDTELAIKSFRRHHALAPDDPITRDFLYALEFNRALDAWHGGDQASAEQGFRAAIELRPGDPSILYHLGYLAYEQKRPEEAARLLQQAFLPASQELREALRPLLYNCSLALRDAGRLEAALEAALTLARHADADSQEIFLAASICVKDGRFLEGKALLERLLQREPGHVGALQYLIAAEKGVFMELLDRARQAIEGGNLAEADKTLAAAREFHSAHPRLTILENQLQDARLAAAADLFVTAREALAAGNLAIAGETWQRGLAICPDTPKGQRLRDEITREFAADRDRQLNAAETALHSGNWNDARDIFTTILSLEPENTEARSGLQRAIQGQDEAISRLLTGGRQALREDRPDLARDRFAELLVLAPGNAEAAAELAVAEHLLAEQSRGYLLRGRRAVELGKLDEARALFEKARQIDDDGTARDELARLDQVTGERVALLVRKAGQVADQGNYRQAEQLYAQVLALQPGHAAAREGRQELAGRIAAAVREHLARGEEAMRREDLPSALTSYRGALDLAPDNSAAQAGLQRVRQRQAEQLTRLVDEGSRALAGGDFAAAGKAADQSLRLDPYNADAIRLRERIEQSRPGGTRQGDEQALYLQGVALYTKGNYPEAIRAWEAVLTLNPGFDKARQNIDKTRRKLRQIEEYRGG